MEKPRLTRQQYLDEMNRILPKQVGWKKGMQVVFAPAGATADTATGINFIGDSPAVLGVTSAAQASVLEQYSVEGF